MGERLMLPGVLRLSDEALRTDPGSLTIPVDHALRLAHRLHMKGEAKQDKKSRRM
jgi:hypothetical protein